MARRALTKSPYMPREEAAVHLQDQFKKMAAGLACGDRSLADDLAQEMSLATLMNKPVATVGYYANGAGNDARDARRKELLRRREDLKRKYKPGEKGGKADARPTPRKCVREPRKTGKRGRPPMNASGSKRVLTVKLERVACSALKRFARTRGQTLERMLLGGMAALALADGEDALAAEFLSI